MYLSKPLLSFKLFIALLCLVTIIISCKQPTPTSVTDIDGNIYPVVKIGNQFWMALNLKVTHYRNGDPIKNIPDNQQWSSSNTGAYCNYNNLPDEYGFLYNWHAINDARNIAPKGWHIPTSEDITTLINTLKGDTIAGAFLKSNSREYWAYPNEGGCNASGFSALPGGYRYGVDGSFHTAGSNGYWWTTRHSYELFSWSKRVYTYFADVQRDPQYLTYGLSVRCVKD